MVTDSFKPSPKQLEAARTTAIAALGHLAGDPEKLAGFLALAGIGPENLRAAAQGPAFLQAVLDYVCADEALLVEISGALGRLPQQIDRDRQILQGPQPDWGA